MARIVGGCGPISWTADRIGGPSVGACGIIWREFMRLGYVRHVLRSHPTMPTAILAGLLMRAPELITVDSASRGGEPSARGGHHRTFRWRRERGYRS